MANTNVQARSGGVGFLGLLLLLFIALKLTNVIAWSWVWVLAPFWIPLAIAIVFFIVAGLFMVIGHLVSKK